MWVVGIKNDMDGWCELARRDYISLVKKGYLVQELTPYSCLVIISRIK